ncbi:response regulator [Desulfitobacterium metallireducens]|uniref:Stage 0 sporulation protein A homolog n=1 Tax=Desulfitobacterium metallireducens DSM 15288 TaxID=871968 RepID=W0EG06_9FIRM|nr:response regulator [Desulfitobacterium metallireducens]AHF08011.1 DNA-binding protein [Desulfitobacterium metallireducens DSM 15288]
MSGYLLVVEQENSTRMRLQEILQNSGFVTKAASSGDEGLRLSFSDDKPSLIILEWQMPVLTGLEILTLLKLNERSKAIPVIMVGGEQQWEEQARKAGAYSFLTKPIASNTLLLNIRGALGLV